MEQVGELRGPAHGTHVVQVGELYLQGCEQGAWRGLHCHGDDLGVQHGRVPGAEPAGVGGGGGPGRKGQASPPCPSPECLPLAHAPPCHVPSRPAGPPTSAGPGSCPGSCRARCPPRTQTSHQPLEGSTAVTLSRLPQPGRTPVRGRASPREEAQAPWSCPPPSHTQHCGWRAGVAVWVP